MTGLTDIVTKKQTQTFMNEFLPYAHKHTDDTHMQNRIYCHYSLYAFFSTVRE